MELRAADEIRWLSVAPKPEHAHERLEYALKGALYEASVIFSRSTVDAVTDVQAQAAASIKAPFIKLRKTWNYDIRSRRRDDLEYQRESSLDGDWRFEGSALQGKTWHHVAQARVLASAAELLFFISESLPLVEGQVLASFFPIGSHVQAICLRLEKPGLYIGRVAKVPGELTEQAFRQLVWPSKTHFELKWSFSKRVIESIRLQLAPFGHVEARLIQPA